MILTLNGCTYRVFFFFSHSVLPNINFQKPCRKTGSLSTLLLCPICLKACQPGAGWKELHPELLICIHTELKAELQPSPDLPGSLVSSAQTGQTLWKCDPCSGLCVRANFCQFLVLYSFLLRKQAIIRPLTVQKWDGPS